VQNSHPVGKTGNEAINGLGVNAISGTRTIPRFPSFTAPPVLKINLGLAARSNAVKQKYQAKLL